MNSQFPNIHFFTYVSNTFIDVLNRATNADWASVKEFFPSLGSQIDAAITTLNRYNNFLGINIAYSPLEIIKLQWAADSRNWWIIIGAVMIPLLSAATQWINLKLTPQANNNASSDKDNPMMGSMKMMNNMMPLMSAFFCFTLPAGMGLYWIAGSVIRSIQQVAINKYIDSMNLEDIIEKNKEKYQEKLRKKGVLAQGIDKKINSVKGVSNNNKQTVKQATEKSEEQMKADKKKAEEYLKKNQKSDGSKKSLAERVNMVKDYNERNNK